MFREGTHQMKPIRFEAGQKQNFIIELDFARECITPDWSITVQAELGEVSVRHP